MFATIKSVIIWTVVAFLILLWLPLLAIVRFFDSDPSHYRTGRVFRMLGKAITKINPGWKLRYLGALMLMIANRISWFVTIFLKRISR